MSTDKEKLMQARDLIAQRAYHQARAVLLEMPTNPTAQQWLAKLEDIASTTSRQPSAAMTDHLAHPSRIDRKVVGALIFGAILVVVLAGLIWYRTRSQGYENGDLSLVYDSGWTTRDSNEITLCQSYDYGCFLVLTDRQYGYTSIAFVKTHLASGIRTSADADAYLWEHYWGREPGAEVVSIEQLTVGGLPATAREFRYPEEGGEPIYMMVVLVVNGDARYDITVWAENEGIFEEDRDDIMAIINSIDFRVSDATM